MKELKIDSTHTVLFPSAEELKGSVIFLLGAGFSKGYHEDRVPLVSDFLDVARKREVLKPNQEHKDFVEFVDKYFGDYRRTNIESLATFLTLQLPPLWSFKQEPRDHYYKILKEIIVKTLGQIYIQPSSAKVKSLYTAFAETLLTMKSTILTFNYDTLLDNLLRKTKQWSVLSGYGIEMKMPMWEYTKNAALQEKSFVSQHKAEADGRAVYLKLHGSLNWGKLFIDPPYEKAAVYVDAFGLTMFEESDGQPGSLDPIHFFTGSGSGPVEASGFSIQGEPFIVPPILSKEDLLKEPLLLNLWYHAMNLFSTAENVIVIGYSFPPTDFLAGLSIRQGMANRFGIHRDQTAKIWCVDKRIDRQYKLRAEMVFLNCDIQFLQMDTVQFLNSWLI